MLDFASQLVNVNIGHQHPAVVKAIQEQAATLATIGPATANLTRGQAAAAHHRRRRPTASRRCSSPTAAPTPTRTPSAWRACTPAATRCCRPTARTTATPARRSSRPATGDGCRTSTPADTCTSSARTCTAASSGRRTPEEESERALHHLERVIQSEGPGDDRRDPARVGAGHRRHPAPAARLPRRASARCATATASC